MIISIGGMNVLIDDEDFQRVAQLHFYSERNPENIRRRLYYFRATSGKKIFKLHRFVIDAKEGEIVDHINGNTLDNRKENLRICTRAENNRNIRKLKSCSSPYKGVDFRKSANKFRARISNNGQQVHLGYFDNELEAWNAYCAAAKNITGNLPTMVSD